jgi:hypothetical protein
MTLSVPAEPTTAAQQEQEAWLTTVLRPAGSLLGRAGARFAAALRAASDSSGVVFVDLRAVGSLPRPIRRCLADADTRLAATGGALLVIDGDATGPDGGPTSPPPAHLLAR